MTVEASSVTLVLQFHKLLHPQRRILRSACRQNDDYKIFVVCVSSVDVIKIGDGSYAIEKFGFAMSYQVIVWESLSLCSVSSGFAHITSTVNSYSVSNSNPT